MPRSKHRYLIAMLAILTAGLGGCSNDRGEASPEKYSRLELGMSLAEVEHIMGGPGQIRRFDNQPADETTYRWETTDSGYHIYVTVKNGKVGSLVDYD